MKQHLYLSARYLVLLCSAVKCGEQFSDLYSPGDVGITNFQGVELGPELASSKLPWLVEFYASWCGHCIEFAQTMKMLGKRVAGWSDAIRIGAVNCASPQNTDTCRRYNIYDYPTLKFFPPLATEKETGTQLFISENNESSNVIEWTAGRMSMWVEEIQNIPEHSDYLKLSPDLRLFNINPNEEEEALKAFSVWKTGSAHNLVVIADQKAETWSVGAIILDVFSQAGQHLLVRKVPLSEVKSFLLMAGVEKLPREDVLVACIQRSSETGKVETKSVLPVEYVSNVTASKIGDKIKLFITNHCISGKNGDRLLPVEQPGSREEKGPLKIIAEEDKIKVNRRRYTVFMSDLERAILYSLSNEVGRMQELKGESIRAVKDFVKVLLDYFPLDMRYKTFLFLEELDAWLSRHDDLQGLSGKDFAEKVEDIRYEKAAFFDTVGEYIGCQGSDPRFGSYPCALWTLWHVLTVRQLMVGRTPTRGETPEKESRKVLSAMVAFVGNIFGCRNCASHFLEMARNGTAIEEEVRTAKDAIIWLWKAHNKANVRLIGDDTDDPVFPKTIFPDMSHCTACWKSNVPKIETDVDLSKDLNVAKVAEFLVLMYTNIDDSGLRPDPKIVDHVLVRGRKTPTALFTFPDVVVIAVVYLISVAVLLIICIRHWGKVKALRKWMAVTLALVTITGMLFVL